MSDPVMVTTKALFIIELKLTLTLTSTQTKNNKYCNILTFAEDSIRIQQISLPTITVVAAIGVDTNMTTQTSVETLICV